MAQDVAVIANLGIGSPNVDGSRIGPGYEIKDEAEQAYIVAEAAECTRPINRKKVAYCIDERPYESVGGIDDPAELEAIVAAQLPGGTYVSATKAAVAAKIAAVRNAKDFTEAHGIVAGILGRAGYDDSVHEKCGADDNVEASVENQRDPEEILPVMQAAGAASEDDADRVATLHANKQSLARNGFYKGWDSAAHRERVRANFPQHYAVLKGANDAVHGHHGKGLYEIIQEGQGFAKNEFARRTDGAMLFAYTHAFAQELAEVMAGSDEERKMLELAFVYDLADVGNVLFAEPTGEEGQPDYYPGMAFIKQGA